MGQHHRSKENPMSATLDPVRNHPLPFCIATEGQAVLVVDDDPSFRSILVTRLVKRGALVHEAEGVSEAIETLHTKHVDVVVCDYNMPHGNGTALLAYLTGRGFPGRFVLMSASLPPEAAAAARGQGAQAIEKWDLLDHL
jgi:DNA-binding NtrC family response regulator